MIRFGIIGAGNIAGRFAASLSHLEDASLVAISARNKEKGRGFAERFLVPYVYENADELLQNPEVDAVYIALPHGMHVEWAMRTLRAKKSVLCEKPAGINADEIRKVAACVTENGGFFMEAMKPRFIAIYEQIRKAVSDGTIGKVTRVEACLCRNFGFSEENTMSYHLDPVMGGCLLDMGIYGASYLCDFLDGAPIASETKCRLRDGVDFYAASELTFPEEKTGRLECAFDEDKPEYVAIIGEMGRITVEHPSRPQKITIETDEGERVLEVPYEVDDFFGEIRHFVDCVKDQKTESNIMPVSETIRCAELIDRIKNDIKRGAGKM